MPAYSSSRYAYEGTETTETSITRTGSALDPTGSAQSRKIVTTANSQWLRPFKAEPYVAWNGVTDTTVTATVYGTVQSGALPLNDEIWMEVEHLKAASGVLGTIVTTTKSNLLASGTSVTLDSSSWSGGGSGAGWSPFKLTRTLDLNPSGSDHAPVGYIEARVRAAKASTTYYIDPTIELSPTTPTAGAITAYKSSRYAYEGTETTETSIVRTNGAVDPAGQVQSRKIVTTANSQWLRPFKAEPYAVWNDITGGNVAVTIYGTVNSGSLPLNDEIWMDVEYLTLAAATGPTAVTWINDASAHNVVLSGGNLVVTNPSAASNDCGARNLTVMQSTGKYYFEATVTTHLGGTGNGIGIALASVTYTNLNAVTAGYNVIRFSNGQLTSNGSTVGKPNLGACPSGTVIGMAFDLDNRMSWIRVAPSGNWNDSGTANPATNTGGLDIPAGDMGPVCNFGSAGAVANNITTVNFGATAFTGAVPSGFTSGWGTGTPAAPLGKIVTTTKANVLASGASVASDSSTWNNAVSVTATLATFDGTATGVTLSGGNLTATYVSGGSSGARSTAVKSLGKYYFEYTISSMVVSSSSGNKAGILLSTGTYSDMISSVSNTTTVILWSGAIWSNNVSTGKNITACNVAGTVIGCAIDLDNRKAWFRKNGGNWNGDVISVANPAIGLGGVTIGSGSFGPALGFNWVAGDAITANFGQTAYAYTPPVDFNNWGSTYWTPFKLTTTLSSPQPGVAGYIHVRPRVAKASSIFYLDPQITLS